MKRKTKLLGKVVPNSVKKRKNGITFELELNKYGKKVYKELYGVLRGKGK